MSEREIGKERGTRERESYLRRQRRSRGRMAAVSREDLDLDNFLPFKTRVHGSTTEF